MKNEKNEKNDPKKPLALSKETVKDLAVRTRITAGLRSVGGIYNCVPTGGSLVHI